MMRGVYLLHFDRPFGHAAHYLGYAGNIADRLARHERGDRRQTHPSGQSRRHWLDAGPHLEERQPDG